MGGSLPRLCHRRTPFNRTPAIEEGTGRRLMRVQSLRVRCYCPDPNLKLLCKGEAKLEVVSC